MINAVFYKDKSLNINGFEISGHAKSDMKGKDLVCAAVSALVQTVIISLKEIYKAEINEETEDEKAGYIKIILTKNNGNEVQLLLQTLLLGLKLIEKDNNKYLNIKLLR